MHRQRDELASLLSEFARTLLTDFSIQGILDHLVARIVKALPVTGVGVTLISPGAAPRYVAASDPQALRYEKLQTQFGDGPCMLSYQSGEPVMSPDLRVETRFPLFTKAALSEGLAAAFSCPLRHGDGQLGALDLYRDTPGPLGPLEMTTAQTLADVAAAYVLNAEAREDARTSAELFRENALHDPLTGLPNRLLMRQRLTHAAERSRRSHTTAAVLFVDLDHFKQVNDSYGHHVGDELLVAVARRLESLVRSGDTLSRMSGDEFVFLCEDLRSPSDIENLATRIDEAFAVPFSVLGHEIAIAASVGMAYAGPGEAITNNLVIDADHAMYEAKRQRQKGRGIIDLRQLSRMRDRTTVGNELRAAMVDDTLDLAYQPIVRSADGLVIGTEALIRWTHPARGLIPASETVAIAEQNGLIDEIGAWVLERSCRARSRWLSGQPDTTLDLSVNVSARQLLNPDFCRTVEAVLDRENVDPATVILELTESIFIQDGPRALTVLQDLKKTGVRLALDDFGTGYSSLSHLHRFPVDLLKIDRSFVERVTLDYDAGAIVAAVTSLAHVLGMGVVAEGVATQDQRDHIVDIGCEAAQGFFYARPMPSCEFGVLMEGATNGSLHLPVQM
jgi:diguanylate cyclase (GGDEF)-like protein